ncbi:hypothetical protein BVY01_03080, partial [bacterium I07]
MRDCFRTKVFFAAEDYIEVKKASDATGKDGTYVVPRSRRGDFEEAEILKDTENLERDKVIPKGSFIYRLSGRDRQKSASYYTPEVLTHTTVKYTLKPILERLENGEMRADELLKLKILEPAMGAAAFHNEAINQIAVAYLDWKQKEKNKKVPPRDYREELQKVKAYIATHNVYGVDINPTAVELGKLSLWLNVIHKDMQTPFFGYRLGVGNAVVGAWRKVYSKEYLILKYANANRTRFEKREWWNKAPRQIPWSGKGSKRKRDEIYHFLLPDKNMVPSANIKMLKEEYPKQAKAINEWKKKFTLPINGDEFRTLQKISDQIDQLFEEHYKQQKEINESTQLRIQVWPQETEQGALFDYYKKERMAGVRNETNAPYYKLKMIMDYWCSLWFWDMRNAEELPTRQDYISDILNILELDIKKALAAQENSIEEDSVDVFSPRHEQSTLDFIPQDAQQRLKAYKSVKEKNRVADVIIKYTAQTALFPDQRKSLISKYSQQYGFFHYELEFVEVFKERSGFDVIVGNPPWVKITFEEGDVIGEKYPEILVRSFTAPQIKIYTEDILSETVLNQIYKSSYIEAENHSNYSNAFQNFNLLLGQQGNLYKTVLQTAFQSIGSNGFIGILHPETVYDDPNGKNLRKVIFKRLKYHFQFINELKLFQDVHDQMKYSINIYYGSYSDIKFENINNLFH